MKLNIRCISKDEIEVNEVVLIEKSYSIINAGSSRYLPSKSAL